MTTQAHAGEFVQIFSPFFISQAIENVFAIAHKIPVGSCFCQPPGGYPNNTITRLEEYMRFDKETCDVSWLSASCESSIEILSFFSFLPQERKGLMTGDCLSSPYASPIFQMSFILFFGTFLISTVLKDFKNRLFFPANVRQVISDFSVIIAIFSMTLLDFFSKIETPKLDVPSEFKPTLESRGWLISPVHEKNPFYSIILAIIPALLGTILIFMDQQITAVIVNRKENKLKKGCGYHLDLFVLAILIQLCTMLGIPWFVAATVLSINHVNSLKLESETAAPGEKPQFLGVREQRFTHIMIFLTIGCSVKLTPLLSHIPMPGNDDDYANVKKIFNDFPFIVLFGVFLYMGAASLKGLQFYDRLLIMLMPVKYQPDYMFLRQVNRLRRHQQTLIINLISSHNRFQLNEFISSLSSNWLVLCVFGSSSRSK